MNFCMEVARVLGYLQVKYQGDISWDKNDTAKNVPDFRRPLHSHLLKFSKNSFSCKILTYRPIKVVTTVFFYSPPVSLEIEKRNLNFFHFSGKNPEKFKLSGKKIPKKISGAGFWVISHHCTRFHQNRCRPSYIRSPEGPFSHAPSLKHVQGGWGGWPTGNGKKLSNSQACCLAQLCLAAA